MQRKTVAVAGIIVACASFPGDGRAQEKLLIQAVLDPKVSVVESVKRECGLETMVGDWVLESVGKKYPGSAKLHQGDGAGNGKVLKVTIVNVVGVGGGAYSGPKSMTVRADLMQSGKVLATTTKERSSCVRRLQGHLPDFRARGEDTRLRRRRLAAGRDGQVSLRR
jgi:hypothetical protein